MIFLPQLFSSDPSAQSFRPSQRTDFGIHWPFRQVASSSPQSENSKILRSIPLNSVNYSKSKLTLMRISSVFDEKITSIKLLNLLILLCEYSNQFVKQFHSKTERFERLQVEFDEHLLSPTHYTHTHQHHLDPDCQ